MKNILLLLFTVVWLFDLNAQAMPASVDGSDEVSTAEEKQSFSVSVYGREIIVYGVESFLIFDMAGKDVTSKNGELNNGIYIVFVNGVALKFVVTG